MSLCCFYFIFHFKSFPCRGERRGRKTQSVLLLTALKCRPRPLASLYFLSQPSTLSAATGMLKIALRNQQRFKLITGIRLAGLSKTSRHFHEFHTDSAQCHSKVISALLSLTYRLIATHNMQTPHERPIVLSGHNGCI